LLKLSLIFIASNTCSQQNKAALTFYSPSLYFNHWIKDGITGTPEEILRDWEGSSRDLANVVMTVSWPILEASRMSVV
jgi:hypothetical protein